MYFFVNLNILDVFNRYIVKKVNADIVYVKISIVSDGKGSVLTIISKQVI